MNKTVFYALFLAVPLAWGCEREGTFEKAGKKVDEAVEEVQEESTQLKEQSEDQLEEFQNNQENGG